MPLPISVFIIAQDEAKRIGQTIEAVRDLSDDIIVIDSGSTDGTQAIAKSLGARVVFNPWNGYGEQKRFGEDQCRQKWRLNLDADEVVTPELNREIRNLFSTNDVPPVGAYILCIVDVMPGDDRPRRFAYAHRYVRLYHENAGRYSASQVHDVVRLNPDVPTKTLKQPVYHFSILDLGEQVAKFNRYTDALVRDLNDRNVIKPTWRVFVDFPVAFLKAYIIRRHFMRGTYGYLTAMNYAFFRHLRTAKCYEERQRNKAKTPD